ncbi:MAG: MotA/TolQ/ExbB proton channel family protein [Burkholderiaceae bacterium]
MSAHHPGTRGPLAVSSFGPAHRAIEPVWMEWLVLAGLLVFATWLLGVEGVWTLLFTADPTGITLIIVIVFTGGTLWAGRRARELARERKLAERALTSARAGAAQGWVAEYLHGLASSPADPTAPIDLLLENTHGSHGTLWWVNGIQLKLGLLGKVIGFSMLALQIGSIENFDPAQSQELLKSLTAGLGVALLTTMVGLVGNIVLGLQLTRLDRVADELVARAQTLGMHLTHSLRADAAPVGASPAGLPEAAQGPAAGGDTTDGSTSGGSMSGGSMSGGSTSGGSTSGGSTPGGHAGPAVRGDSQPRTSS